MLAGPTQILPVNVCGPALILKTGTKMAGKYFEDWNKDGCTYQTLTDTYTCISFNSLWSSDIIWWNQLASTWLR